MGRCLTDRQCAPLPLLFLTLLRDASLNSECGPCHLLADYNTAHGTAFSAIKGLLLRFKSNQRYFLRFISSSTLTSSADHVPSLPGNPQGRQDQDLTTTTPPSLPPLEPTFQIYPGDGVQVTCSEVSGTSPFEGANWDQFGSSEVDRLQNLMSHNDRSLTVRDVAAAGWRRTAVVEWLASLNLLPRDTLAREDAPKAPQPQQQKLLPVIDDKHNATIALGGAPTGAAVSPQKPPHHRQGRIVIDVDAPPTHDTTSQRCGQQPKKDITQAVKRSVPPANGSPIVTVPERDPVPPPSPVTSQTLPLPRLNPEVLRAQLPALLARLSDEAKIREAASGLELDSTAYPGTSGTTTGTDPYNLPSVILLNQASPSTAGREEVCKPRTLSFNAPSPNGADGDDANKQPTAPASDAAGAAAGAKRALPDPPPSSELPSPVTEPSLRRRRSPSSEQERSDGAAGDAAKRRKKSSIVWEPQESLPEDKPLAALMKKPAAVPVAAPKKPDSGSLTDYPIPSFPQTVPPEGTATAGGGAEQAALPVKAPAPGAATTAPATVPVKEAPKGGKEPAAKAPVREANGRAARNAEVASLFPDLDPEAVQKVLQQKITIRAAREPTPPPAAPKVRGKAAEPKPPPPQPKQQQPVPTQATTKDATVTKVQSTAVGRRCISLSAFYDPPEGFEKEIRLPERAGEGGAGERRMYLGVPQRQGHPWERLYSNVDYSAEASVHKITGTVLLRSVAPVAEVKYKGRLGEMYDTLAQELMAPPLEPYIDVDPDAQRLDDVFEKITGPTVLLFGPFSHPITIEVPSHEPAPIAAPPIAPTAPAVPRDNLTVQITVPGAAAAASRRPSGDGAAGATQSKTKKAATPVAPETITITVPGGAAAEREVSKSAAEKRKRDSPEPAPGAKRTREERPFEVIEREAIAADPRRPKHSSIGPPVWKLTQRLNVSHIDSPSFAEFYDPIWRYELLLVNYLRKKSTSTAQINELHKRVQLPSEGEGWTHDDFVEFLTSRPHMFEVRGPTGMSDADRYDKGSVRVRGRAPGFLEWKRRALGHLRRCPNYRCTYVELFRFAPLAYDVPEDELKAARSSAMTYVRQRLGDCVWCTASSHYSTQPEDRRLWCVMR